MANIDEIIKEILAQANHTADANISAAKAEADKILSNAKAECQKRQKELDAKTEQAKKAALERAESAASQQKRQKVLNGKQEIISSMLDKAHSEILAMQDDTYFAFVEKLIKKCSLPKDGEIFFSKKDLERLPSGFADTTAEIAKANGGSLTISKETREIDGGFVLSYGGIEENCSISSLFHANKETLTDKVHELLFL